MEDALLRDVLTVHFGIEAPGIKRLQGYENGTFLVRGPKKVAILKQYNTTDPDAYTLPDENRVLKHLAEKLPGCFPEVIPSVQGMGLTVYHGHTFRLLSFLPGTFLAETTQSTSLITHFGEFMGEMSAEIHSLPPGNLASKEIEWDLQHLQKNHTYLSHISDNRDRALVDYFLMQFEREVLPYAYRLRKAVIHNDANDWNVLCKGDRVSGLIDFGDMCYSWQVNEVAVALTYILMEQGDPLAVARDFIQAYHAAFSLQTLEVDLLYYLVAGRLCMSLCQSARAAADSAGTRDEKHLEYINISQLPARRLLHRWIGLSPVKARQVFRQAIGAPGTPPPESQDMLRRRKRFFSAALSVSYDSPIAMDRAGLQYMYDHTGKSYLDAYNNIMLVGHAHPGVVRAASYAMGRLNTNTRYLYPILDAYAENLLDLFPAPLDKLFLVNSGSAATDLALRLARAYTGKRKVLALEQGYHGNTSAGIAVSHYKHERGAAYPDTLTGPFPGNHIGDVIAEQNQQESFISEYLRIVEANKGTIAACIAEPIMGCGGQLPLPQGFLEALYPVVREQGGLCISDEVQVGFGRLGESYWGFQMHGVVPDIVILGKPMGNGHPIGGVVTTAAVAEAFAEGPEFFSSFGGNPVSCAVGNAVLNSIADEGLRQHAQKTGAMLIHELSNLKKDHAQISQIRGSGLFIGVSLVTPDNRPDATRASALSNALKTAGILTSTDGPYRNVLKIKPPLPFNSANTELLCNEIDRILRNSD